MSDSVPSSTDTVGSSPGAILKRCREYHDISLEEVSQTTKIGINYLISLEEDQISGFASQTYLKGFLRIYSAYLGLNPDDISRMYDKLHGVKGVQGDAEPLSAEVARPSRYLAWLQKLLLPAVLLLFILITAALFKSQPAPTVRLPQPAATPPATIPVTAVQPARTSAKIAAVPEIEASRVETRATVTNSSDKPVQPKKAADPPKGFILKIKVTQNGNLNAAVDGSLPQVYELTVGDVIEWKAEKSVALDLSNAGGVDVELNGKPVKSLGPPGKPAYVVVDADGVRP